MLDCACTVLVKYLNNLLSGNSLHWPLKIRLRV